MSESNQEQPESESMDMSPEQAAQVALGDEQAAAGPAAGGMPGMSPEKPPWWKRTEPNTPIEQIENVEDWQEYWKEYLIRGAEKASGANDAWAVIDLLRGGVGGVLAIVEEYDI